MKKLFSSLFISAFLLMFSAAAISVIKPGTAQAMAAKVNSLVKDNKEFCSPDLNNDDQVDRNDINILLANWGKLNMSPQQGDLNKDNKVDGLDLSYLLDKWSNQHDN